MTKDEAVTATQNALSSEIATIRSSNVLYSFLQTKISNAASAGIDNYQICHNGLELAMGETPFSVDVLRDAILALREDGFSVAYDATASQGSACVFIRWR